MLALAARLSCSIATWKMPVLAIGVTMQSNGNVLDFGHEPLVLALLHDHDVSVRDLELGAGREVAREDDPLGTGRDIDEAADTRGDMRLRVQSRDVHVAVRVDLQERQEGAIEATALQVGELVRGRQERVGVLGTTELEAEERDAADGALLDDPGHRAVEP